MPQLSPHTMLGLVSVLYLIVALLLLSSKPTAEKLNITTPVSTQKKYKLIYQ